MTENARFMSSHLMMLRAEEQISALSQTLEEVRPFRYIYEVNANSGQRCLFAERNEVEIGKISILCSEVVHSLRVAIEHAYSAVVTPHVSDAKAIKRIQFPSSKLASEVPNRCKAGSAYEVSKLFADAIVALGPHSESDGDRELYLICNLNNEAKHKGLVPMGYYTEWTIGQLREEIPDAFLGMSASSRFVFGQNRIDAMWHGAVYSIHDRIREQVPLDGILRREVSVPVRIGFVGHLSGLDEPLAIPTLEKLVETAKRTVSKIMEFG